MLEIVCIRSKLWEEGTSTLLEQEHVINKQEKRLQICELKAQRVKRVYSQYTE